MTNQSVTKDVTEKQPNGGDTEGKVREKGLRTSMPALRVSLSKHLHVFTDWEVPNAVLWGFYGGFTLVD